MDDWEREMEVDGLDPFDEPEIDLEDLLLMGLGSTVSRLADMLGTHDVFPTARVMGLNGEVTITIDEQNLHQPARERFEEILGVSSTIAGCSTRDVLDALLDADGWSWTPLSLRTPLWLMDICEWSMSSLVDRYPEVFVAVP